MDEQTKQQLDQKFNVTENTVRAIHHLAEMEDLSLIEAAVKYAADHDIEPDVIGAIIAQDPLTRSLIEVEARSLHCLKPQSKAVKTLLE